VALDDGCRLSGMEGSEFSERSPLRLRHRLLDIRHTQRQLVLAEQPKSSFFLVIVQLVIELFH